MVQSTSSFLDTIRVNNGNNIELNDAQTSEVLRQLGINSNVVLTPVDNGFQLYPHDIDTPELTYPIFGGTREIGTQDLQLRSLSELGIDTRPEIRSIGELL